MISNTEPSSSYRLSRTQPDSTKRAESARAEGLYDAALVLRFNAGDETAFVEIVGRYRERMFNVAYSALKNRADAEEISQDTFIRAHRGLAKFRGESSLATWLHRIALNLSRNRYWHGCRRHQHARFSIDSPLSDSNASSFADLIASDAASPAREAVTNEFSELVEQCMTRLDASKREVLTLRNTQRRSYVAIGRELGINVGTVKSRIARARESLRVLLAESFAEFAADARPLVWLEAFRPEAGLRAVCA